MRPRLVTLHLAAASVIPWLTLPVVAQPRANERVPADGYYSVKQYGATGDGKAKDTNAIRRAIDAASAAGGGVVYFPPGVYLSGTLHLADRVTLHLAGGATLLGSTDRGDYPEHESSYPSYTDNYVCQALIWAENVSDIAIVGRGVIDGQGDAPSFKFEGAKAGYRKRPYIIRFVRCRNVLVADVTLHDSPMWMQHYLACDNVTVRGITVHSRVNHNNDMMNIDGCRNVRIADCYGESDDDAITLKSTADRVCENVTVTNCVVSSACNAIKCGTESNGGFKNITISNCAVFDTGIAGLALEMVDGGILDGVAVNNLTMNGVRAPIFLRLGNRARPIRKDLPKPGMGTFRNVVISNIVAVNATKLGCSITGLPGHPIRGVTLSNLRLSFAGGGTAEDAAREVPEVPAKYPECSMFGPTVPAYAFYCRHVDGLTFRDIDVTTVAGDQRPAFVCDDVRNLQVHGFNARSTATDAPMIMLKNVTDGLIQGCRPYPTATAFLRLEDRSANISAVANDLTRVKTAFQFGETTPRKVLHAKANRTRNQ